MPEPTAYQTLQTQLYQARHRRDFCFIANLLAATAQNPDAVNQVNNVAVGERTSLNDLYAQLHRKLLPRYPQLEGAPPVRRDFRAGDVRHSLADIGKAQSLLGYAPTQRIGERAGAGHAVVC